MVLKLGTSKQAKWCWTNCAMAAAAPRSELPACNTSFSDNEMIDREYWPPRGGGASGPATFF